MATDELAQRYGRRDAPRMRRMLVIAGAVVLVSALGYAAWYALTTGNPKVTWQDLGYRNTADGVDVTFEVTFSGHADASAVAVCTIEGWNEVRTVIGTRDVRVGPIGDSDRRTIRVTAAVRTSESANTGLVNTCALIT